MHWMIEVKTLKYSLQAGVDMQSLLKNWIESPSLECIVNKSISCGPVCIHGHAPNGSKACEWTSIVAFDI